MNYYERHIGDYLKDTAHLSLLEHGVYSRLLDVYYTRESAIPADQVERLIGARSKDERVALAVVVAEFFTVEADALRHTRCEREIERFHDKQRKAAASANARWSKSKPHSDGTADAMRTHSEGNADGMHRAPVPSNQTPDTSNQAPPKTKTARKRAAPAVLVSVDDMVAEGVDRQHAVDWLVNRKTKGLAPLTPTIWTSTKDEAVKAGMTPGQAIATAAKEGWGGFKAGWPTSERSAPAKASRHAGFDTKDYRAGVTEDGCLT